MCITEYKTHLKANSNTLIEHSPTHINAYVNSNTKVVPLLNRMLHGYMHLNVYIMYNMFILHIIYVLYHIAENFDGGKF